MDIFKKLNISFLSIVLLLYLGFFISQQAIGADDGYDPEVLGIAFANAIAQRDTAAMGYLIDLDALIEKAASHAYTEQNDIDSFKQGFLTKIPTATALMDTIMVEMFREQFVVKYLKVVNGRPLIRYDFVSGGHEYMFLLPSKGNENKILAEDLLFISRGKSFSNVFTEAAQLTSKQSPEALKRLLDLKEVDVDFTQSFNRITNLLTEGKFQDAYEQLQAMPESVKNTRFMIDMAIQLAGQIGAQEYQKQLVRLEKYHGDDPTTSFTLIDYHLLKENFTKAIKAIRVLQNSLGNDAALESLIATVHFASGDIELAEQHAIKAISLEADFENAYWILANAKNASQSHNETVAVFDQLEAIFGYEFTMDDIAREPSYAELIKSKTFTDWISK